MITVACPSCSHEIKAKDEHEGKAGKCKHCGETIRIPVKEKTVFESEEYQRELKKADAKNKEQDNVPRNADGYIDWYGVWCPNCRNRCSVMKSRGNGFIFGVFILVSIGLALILLPFLPREWHCLSCQNRWRA